MPGMEWYAALGLMIGLAVLLMMLGVPVALAFLATNLLGAVLFLGGEAGLIQVGRNMVEAVASFQLAPIAAFLLMGEILFQTGLANRAIDAVDRLITRVPGRLSIVAILGGTTFSALSGSTMANTAMLGSTLMPEMRKRGYHLSMAMGPILGTGGIAMLIPPSGLAILLGSLSGISIAGILIGGAVPGFLIAAAHLGYVVFRCWRNPKLAPAYDLPETSFGARIRPFLIYVLPLLGLFVLVVGSILGGFATPTESAALGAIGSVLAAICYRRFSWQRIEKAMYEAGKITVMILFIIVASLTFSQLLAFSGATNGLLNLVKSSNPDPMTLLAGMMLITLFLGCFMDPLSIMLITLPFFVPLADTAGFDLIWFGVLMLLALEISQTTPPFGILLFVMKGVTPDATMRQIYASVTPFILLELLILALLMLVPETVTWLPELLSRN